ncbi:epoxide hydrolase [Flagelloscypha sp. PMI_526]|nr:epoxide hydrolase [Flagelloscypha sp. PMI_526]
MTFHPVPLKVEFSNERVERMKYKVQDFELPEAEVVPGADWDYGVTIEWAKKLQDYWTNSFNWKRAEDKINKWPHFTVDIEGISVHFIHQLSSHENAIPIMLIHGWPGSFYEFHKVIEPLTNPPAGEQAFHVVVPSLPGFGFSSNPPRKSWTVKDTARIFDILMSQVLKYEEYGVQGGDWGSVVSTHMSFYNGLKAVHLNMCTATSPYTPLLLAAHFILPSSWSQSLFKWLYTPTEYHDIAHTIRSFKVGSGYYHEQATQPMTIGYALNDSPMGIAIWIGEKYHAITDKEGDLTEEDLCTTLSLYYLTKTFASSVVIYYENFNMMTEKPTQITKPLGVTQFPKDVFVVPRRWVKRTHPGLTYHNRHDRGGHFAGLENPEALVKDVREFFTTQKENFVSN